MSSGVQLKEKAMNEELETMFSYAQQIAACFVRALAKGRFSKDDEQAVKYLCRVIIDKLEE